MRLVLRFIAVVTALSVGTTASFIVNMVQVGGLRPLLDTGLLGVMTIVGWGLTIVAGPVAVVQLWRTREIGRRLGMLIYGYAVMYYVVGLMRRSPEASVGDIVTAAILCALPVVVLLLPVTRAATAERGCQQRA